MIVGTLFLPNIQLSYLTYLTVSSLNTTVNILLFFKTSKYFKTYKYQRHTSYGLYTYSRVSLVKYELLRTKGKYEPIFLDWRCIAVGESCFNCQ